MTIIDIEAPSAFALPFPISQCSGSAWSVPGAFVVLLFRAVGHLLHAVRA